MNGWIFCSDLNARVWGVHDFTHASYFYSMAAVLTS